MKEKKRNEQKLKRLHFSVSTSCRNRFPSSQIIFFVSSGYIWYWAITYIHSVIICNKIVTFVKTLLHFLLLFSQFVKIWLFAFTQYCDATMKAKRSPIQTTSDKNTIFVRRHMLKMLCGQSHLKIKPRVDTRKHLFVLTFLFSLFLFKGHLLFYFF